MGSYAAAVERRTAADLQEACHGEGQPQEGSRGTAPRSKANRAGPKGNLRPALRVSVRAFLSSQSIEHTAKTIFSDPLSERFL